VDYSFFQPVGPSARRLSQLLGAMKSTPIVPHFEQVDHASIQAQFFEDRKHRALLRIPLRRDGKKRTLCIIGQNPSSADENNADSTIRYLEELIYLTRPEYTELLVLNLYSRVDTTKAETQNLLNCHCVEIFESTLCEHQDFLLVYGKLKNEGAYKFPERALEVAAALRGKTILMLGLGTPYPPHPGNPRILYRNFDVQLEPYYL
jgi:hypothetical protein